MNTNTPARVRSLMNQQLDALTAITELLDGYTGPLTGIDDEDRKRLRDYTVAMTQVCTTAADLAKLAQQEAAAKDKATKKEEPKEPKKKEPKPELEEPKPEPKEPKPEPAEEPIPEEDEEDMDFLD